ncbi:hypothetical protein [Martelella endophytica]|uniref:hypothetical protein n=1 Tax=Martelella endophytica TaxID=1486262 RepID=UPI000A5D31E7|nr:hypothetical protein [Martelella endophytica]
MMVRVTIALMAWAFLMPMHWPYAAFAIGAIWLVWSVREFIGGFRMGIDEMTRGRE